MFSENFLSAHLNQNSLRKICGSIHFIEENRVHIDTFIVPDICPYLPHKPMCVFKMFEINGIPVTGDVMDFARKNCPNVCPRFGV